MKIIIISGLALLILLIGFFILKPGDEKGLIDTWLIENNLNQYGDAKDTVYMGGTPLFDEKTGKTIDKYKYILQRHSDRPWKK